MIPLEDYKLEGMLALYSSLDGAGYVEMFDVQVDGDGRSVLGAGRPLSAKAVQEIVQSLSSSLVLEGFGMLPERLLGMRPDGSLIWYRPAGTAHFFLAEHLGRDGRYPVPAMLFTLKGTTLYVHALDSGAERPGEKTKVFLFPCWNVYSNGSMCMGSAQMPELEEPVANRVRQTEDAFFESRFSHGGGRCKSGDLKALWARLRNRKRFPMKELLPSDEARTLGAHMRGHGF